MRIVILNGDPEAGSDFESYLEALRLALFMGGHDVDQLDLRELDIRRCRGCEGCWTRTPGQCVGHDGSPIVCREAIAADLVVFAAPMVAGFPTELLKRGTDKLIPLLHPYLRIVEGETRHRKRYERYPLMAMLLDKGSDSEDEDVSIVSAIWSRTALAFHSTLVLTAVTDSPPEEVARAIADL